VNAELEENLLGQERQPGGQGPEEESTSGVLTVNSVKSQKTADSIDNKYWKEYRDQMGALKMENMRLLQELIESQKSYQTLLQQALEEQRAQVDALTHLCENRKTAIQESRYEGSLFYLSQFSFQAAHIFQVI
jgi:mitogen-activated protein kinase kinase kinase 5